MNCINKVFIALAVLMLGIGTAKAEFRLGVRGGMLVNKLHFDKEIVNVNNSYGWTAGAVAEYTVPVIGLSFDAGLMYARMNNSTDAAKQQNLDEKIYGKNFFEIPVNIKYKFHIPAVESIIRPYIFTGPNIAFALETADDLSSNLRTRTCQVAWNAGLGVELIRHLQIGASYGFGINDAVRQIPGNVTSADIKVKNNYWTVSATWLFWHYPRSVESTEEEKPATVADFEEEEYPDDFSIEEDL